MSHTACAGCANPVLQLVPLTVQRAPFLGKMLQQTDKGAANSSDHVYVYAEGSHQILEDSNHFLGYGVRPVMKEFGPKPRIGGDVRWSAQFGYINNNNTAELSGVQGGVECYAACGT